MHPVLALLIAFAGALVLTAALDFIAASAWRKSTNLHWSERARLLFHARRNTSVNVFLLPCCAVLFGLRYSGNDTAVLICIALAAFAGSVLGAIPLQRSIFPHVTARQSVTQLLQVWGTRLLLFGPLIAVVFLMPRGWNWRLLGVALTFAGFHLWFGSVGYFQVLIWLKLLKPAPPQTLEILEDCFATTGVRPRAVWLMDSPLALAFAVPTRKELLFSDTLIAKLSREEIKAITYHELAHLSEDKVTITRRVLGLLAFYPFIFVRPLFAALGPAAFVPIYVIFFLLLFLNLRLGKKMERRADAEAFSRQQEEGSYARALETLYRLNFIPAVMPSRGQIHPHLYDRMLAAGLTPDFPRPRPPATFHWTVLIPILVWVLLIVAVV